MSRDVLGSGISKVLGASKGVSSVNAQTGVVVLAPSDIGAVSSVNTKTGAVVLAASDVGARPFAAEYKLLTEMSGGLNQSVTAATRILGQNNALTISTGATSSAAPTIFNLSASDLAVSGKTTKLRLKALLGTNPTSLGTMVITFSLAPLLSVGTGAGANQMSYTPDTAIAASVLTFTNPTTNIVPGTGAGVQTAEFTMPADGAYAFLLTNDHPTPTGSGAYWGVRLSAFHV